MIFLFCCCYCCFFFFSSFFFFFSCFFLQLLLCLFTVVFLRQNLISDRIFFWTSSCKWSDRSLRRGLGVYLLTIMNFTTSMLLTWYVSTPSPTTRKTCLVPFHFPNIKALEWPWTSPNDRNAWHLGGRVVAIGEILVSNVEDHLPLVCLTQWRWTQTQMGEMLAPWILSEPQHHPKLGARNRSNDVAKWTKWKIRQTIPQNACYELRRTKWPCGFPQ